jgi:hypothetical protein
MSTCTQKNNSLQETALQCRNPLLSENRVAVLGTFLLDLELLFCSRRVREERVVGNTVGPSVFSFVRPSVGLRGVTQFSVVWCKLYIKSYLPLFAAP